MEEGEPRDLLLELEEANAKNYDLLKTIEIKDKVLEMKSKIIKMKTNIIDEVKVELDKTMFKLYEKMEIKFYLAEKEEILTEVKA